MQCRLRCLSVAVWVFGFVGRAQAVEPDADAGAPPVSGDVAPTGAPSRGTAPEEAHATKRPTAGQFGSFGATGPAVAGPAALPGPQATTPGAAPAGEGEALVRDTEPARVDAPGLYFATHEARSSAFVLMLRPEIGVQGGIENWALSAAATPPGAGVDVSVSSKLGYPVATAVAGGTLLVGAGKFSFAASALANIVDPWGTLLDQDFFTASDATQSQTLEISHTDSRTTLRALALEGAVRVRFAELSRTRGRGTLHAVAGFRYESSVYDAYGASGWQLDSTENQVPVATDGEPWALHYEVRYYLPFLGVGVDLGEGKPFAFSSEARFLAGWSTHEDDHILRHKRGHVAAQGVGVALVAEPAFTVAGNDSFRVLVGLSGQLQIVGSVAGRLHQEYYADDPGLAGDQLGQPIPDAAFSFLSLRARLLAFAAVRF